jgi:hypothetical protein
MLAKNIDKGVAAAPFQNANDSSLPVLFFSTENKRNHPDSHSDLNKKSRTTLSRSPSSKNISAAL